MSCVHVAPVDAIMYISCSQICGTYCLDIFRLILTKDLRSLLPLPVQNGQIGIKDAEHAENL